MERRMSKASTGRFLNIKGEMPSNPADDEKWDKIASDSSQRLIGDEIQVAVVNWILENR